MNSFPFYVALLPRRPSTKTPVELLLRAWLTRSEVQSIGPFVDNNVGLFYRRTQQIGNLIEFELLRISTLRMNIRLHL